VLEWNSIHGDVRTIREEHEAEWGVRLGRLLGQDVTRVSSRSCSTAWFHGSVTMSPTGVVGPWEAGWATSAFTPLSIFSVATDRVPVAG
jgi:hypothetical protein